MTLSDFLKVLSEAGQWLPIDPPDDGRATLGGVAATGLGGAQSPGSGPLRSFVIGMRVVLADGRTIKAGGNVVKNVAGYDLCKLFTGSYGTLGLITELTFKLRRLPAETRTIIASGSLASLIGTGRRVASEFFPVAVELLSPQMTRNLGIETSRDECALLVRFAGSSRAVVTQTAKALKVLREDANRRCATHDEDDALWRKLSAASLQPFADLVCRATMRPSELPSFLGDVAALEKDDSSLTHLQWEAALSDGRIRAIAVRALEGLRQKAENVGGKIVIEKAPIEIRNEFDSWGSFGSAKELMKRVKSQLDPQNLLSPGRFGAGI